LDRNVLPSFPVFAKDKMFRPGPCQGRLDIARIVHVQAHRIRRCRDGCEKENRNKEEGSTKKESNHQEEGCHQEEDDREEEGSTQEEKGGPEEEGNQIKSCSCLKEQTGVYFSS
jgi:hypothetical protein